jgi:hypothetical protein
MERNALKLRKGKILNYGKECIKTQERENIKLWKRKKVKLRKGKILNFGKVMH